MKKIIPFSEILADEKSCERIHYNHGETIIELSRTPVKAFYSQFPYDVWVREVTFARDEVFSCTVVDNSKNVIIPRERIEKGKGYYIVYYFVEEDGEELVNDSKNFESNKDDINHPQRYQSDSGIEVIDVIEAFTKDLHGVVAFDIGNALKYLCRWKKKGGIDDLKKAKWYIDHVIEKSEDGK